MTPVARRNPVVNCPLTAAWAAIGGKWKLTIVYWLAERPLHFAALRRQLNAVSEGVSQKVLAQQLHELIADGIVARDSTGAAPAPVIYSLTEYGCSVLPMLDMVRVWGLGHIARAQRTASGVSRETPNCLANRRLPRGRSSPVPGGDCPIPPARG